MKKTLHNSFWVHLKLYLKVNWFKVLTYIIRFLWSVIFSLVWAALGWITVSDWNAPYELCSTSLACACEYLSKNQTLSIATWKPWKSVNMQNINLYQTPSKNPSHTFSLFPDWSVWAHSAPVLTCLSSPYGTVCSSGWTGRACRDARVFLSPVSVPWRCWPPPTESRPASSWHSRMRPSPPADTQHSSTLQEKHTHRAGGVNLCWIQAIPPTWDAN